MGGNLCKELGISPSKTIGTKDLESLWDGYAKGKKNLSKSDAHKFLKQFSVAIGSNDYSKSQGDIWLKAADPQKKGESLDYDNFLNLFLQAIKEGESNTKVDLTATLAQKLNFGDLDLDLPSEEEDVLPSKIDDSKEKPSQSVPQETSVPRVIRPYDPSDWTTWYGGGAIANQPAKLTIAGEKDALILTKLDIQAKVTGFLAETSYTMTFKNPHTRNLEGELNFPLPEDAVVNGFAMEMKGPGSPLVSAVPVEKQVARAAFEAQVRSGKTAGLVEAVKGNSFKTRVYPLPANSTKTVRVSYLSEVISVTAPGASKNLFVIPLCTDPKYPLEEFNMKIEVNQNIKSAPEIEDSSLKNLSFIDVKKTGKFVAEINKKKVVLGKPTAVGLPVNKKNGVESEILVESGKLPLKDDDEYLTKKKENDKEGLFFMINDYITIPKIIDFDSEKNNKIEGKIRIGILYDASKSRENTNKSRELSIIDKLLTQTIDTSTEGLIIDVIILRNTKENPVKFDIKTKKEIENIIKFLQNIVCDGATAFGDITALRKNDEENNKTEYSYWLFFSDGLGTVGKAKPKEQDLQVPMFIFSSEPTNNSSLLSYLSQKTGGRYFNLLTSAGNDEKIIKDIIQASSGAEGTQPFGFIKAVFSPSELEQVFPSHPVPIESDRFTLCGIITSSSPTIEVTIQYGFGGGKITHSQKISIPVPKGNEPSSGIISRYWAQQKVNDLQLFSSKNKTDLVKLGQRYGFVTSGASLIVLDSLEEYLKYDIVPNPQELPEIAQLFQNKKYEADESEQVRIRNKLNSVSSMWRTRTDWHDKDFPRPPTKQEALKQKKVSEITQNLSSVEAEINSARAAQATELQRRRDQEQREIREREEEKRRKEEEAKRKVEDEKRKKTEQEESKKQPEKEQKEKQVVMRKRLATTEIKQKEEVCEKKMKSKKIAFKSKRKISPSMARPSAEPESESLSMCKGDSAFDEMDCLLDDDIVECSMATRSERPSSSSSSLLQPGISLMSKLSSGPSPSRSLAPSLSRNAGAPPPSRGLSQACAPPPPCGARSSIPAPSPVPSSSLVQPSPPGSSSTSTSTSTNVSERERAVVNEEEEGGGAPSISIKNWDPSTPYLNKIKAQGNGNPEKCYEIYLSERKEHGSSPAFYLDVAEYFFRVLKRKDLGLRILTNICELELESHQLYRIIGYKLDQQGELEQSINVFRKVLKMRPDEPQSHRDLGLVISKTGDYEEALIHLWNVVTGNWDYRFQEIELTALTEVNRILTIIDREGKTKDVTLPDHLDLSKWKHSMEMDIRISMAWDSDNTDIDLHVIEPSGEECYYCNHNTKHGGLLSRDFTGGYGPEEYVCKLAPEGTYKIRAKYFSSHQQSLTGGTTILLSFFTNYSRPEEKMELITIRLQASADIVDVGEVEFVANARTELETKALEQLNQQIESTTALIETKKALLEQVKKDHIAELAKFEEEKAVRMAQAQ